MLIVPSAAVLKTFSDGQYKSLHDDAHGEKVVAGPMGLCRSNLPTAHTGGSLSGALVARLPRVLRRGLRILWREIGIADRHSDDRLVAVLLTLVSEEVEARSHKVSPGRRVRRCTFGGSSNVKVSDNQAEYFSPG